MVGRLIEPLAGGEGHLAVAPDKVVLRHHHIGSVGDLDVHAFVTFQVAIGRFGQCHLGRRRQGVAAALDGDIGDILQFGQGVELFDLARDGDQIAGVDGKCAVADKDAISGGDIAIAGGILQEEAVELVAALEVGHHNTAGLDHLPSKGAGGDAALNFVNLGAGWRRDNREVDTINAPARSRTAGRARREIAEGKVDTHAVDRGQIDGARIDKGARTGGREGDAGQGRPGGGRRVAAAAVVGRVKYAQLRIGLAAIAKAGGVAEAQGFAALGIHVQGRRDQPLVSRSGVTKAIAFDIFVGAAATEPGIGRVGIHAGNRPAGRCGWTTIEAFAQGEGLPGGHSFNRSWGADQRDRAVNHTRRAVDADRAQG